jgi:structural maintenance of chromosome 2
MALLQFKPAPMYIFDEIDAALDLSHTQHIGTLFHTRFRDVTSVVERTVERSASLLHGNAEREDGHEVAGAVGASRRAARRAAATVAASL